jgi:ATP-binding cassette subfamily F protein 3
MLVWQRPNLLLLDEPTNHLDLTTREALSMALNEFEGTVMLVSHDRALLREVCDEFWLVTRGGIQDFDGDLDDYQRWLLEQSREQARAYAQAQRAGSPASLASAPSKPVAMSVPSPLPAPALASSGDPAKRRDERKAQAQQRQKAADHARPLRQELTKLEARMAAASKLRDTATARLADPALEPAARAEQGRQLKLLSEEIAALEARWLEVGESIDALNAAV